MEYSCEKLAGALIFVGAVQFILCMVVAESLYPNYSISENYISDLGVGSTSLIFNLSVFFLGATAFAATYLLRRVIPSKMLLFCLALCGIGAMGVGIFPENSPFHLHTMFSLAAFLFGALSAITSYSMQKSPLSYFSVALGFLSLAALTLFIVAEVHLRYFSLSFNLSFGLGGTERMIVYPVILWAIGFGGHLIGQTRKS